MSLSTGPYTIRSAAFDQPFVSRSPAEDRSFLPKRILSLPDTITDPTFLQWDIENLGDGGYYLRNRGSPTAVINDLVFAILLSEPPGEQWDLQQLPQYGDNQYLIQTNNGSWFLPSDYDYTQVESELLIVLPVEPVQYPPNFRWIIESLD